MKDIIHRLERELELHNDPKVPKRDPKHPFANTIWLRLSPGEAVGLISVLKGTNQ